MSDKLFSLVVYDSKHVCYKTEFSLTVSISLSRVKSNVDEMQGTAPIMKLNNFKISCFGNLGVRKCLVKAKSSIRNAS